ncbi:MAG: LPS assembly protein LptD [Myxococcota bacterium]
MPRAFFLAALVVSILLGGAAAAVSADERARLKDPFEITADRILYEAEGELYVAEGDVHVVQADRSLVARWVAYSKKTGIGVAEGDVEIVDGPDRLNAAFMVFDIETLQGTLFQVAFDSGGNGFRLRAKEMIRTGKNTFVVDDAVFSTCRCAPGKRLPWQIETGRADVELGGYGQLTNSTFEVLGVPVLWIPWMLVPIKSERESGLLLPQFQFGGRGGATFGLPIFLAPIPQLNVTATPRYFVNRGFKQDVELEYVFGERSGGRLFVAGLHDQTKQAQQSFNPPRWGVIWEHDHALPADWRWQTDLKLASDNLYADDFPELQRYKTFRFNESTTSIARSFGESGGIGAMVGARYADDYQGSSFQDRDKFILQRFGELRGDVEPGTLRSPGGFDARLDSELIHFRGLHSPQSELGAIAPPPVDPAAIRAATIRNNGHFYDFGVDARFQNGTGGNGEGDGLFQPGEPLLERGTRMVLHPRLARPTAIGDLFEFTPELGWSQTLYQSNAQDFAERSLVTARADLRSRLARDYTWEDGRALRHVIEPRLGWAWVSEDVFGRSQNHNPLFIPRGTVEQSRFRSLALENLTRNPSDRIQDTQTLVLGVNQKFFTRKGPRAMPQLSGDVTTAVDWDFGDNGAIGDLFADARLLHLGPVASRLKATFNPETQALKEGEAEVGIGWPFDHGFVRRVSLGTRYRYLRRLPAFFETVRGDVNAQRTGDTVLNQVDITSQIELSTRIRLSYRSVYSLAEAKAGFLRNRGMIEYVSKCRCWGVGVALYQERRVGLGGGFMIRFLGLGDDETDLFEGGFGTGLNF